MKQIKIQLKSRSNDFQLRIQFVTGCSQKQDDASLPFKTGVRDINLNSTPVLLESVNYAAQLGNG